MQRLRIHVTFEKYNINYYDNIIIIFQVLVYTLLYWFWTAMCAHSALSVQYGAIEITALLLLLLQATTTWIKESLLELVTLGNPESMHNSNQAVPRRRSDKIVLFFSLKMKWLDPVGHTWKWLPWPWRSEGSTPPTNEDAAVPVNSVNWTASQWLLMPVFRAPKRQGLAKTQHFLSVK